MNQNLNNNYSFFFYLKEQLLRGKIRTGEMANIGVHLITGVIRSFLLSLKEPLVTYTARESFIKLAYIQEEIDVQVINIYPFRISMLLMDHPCFLDYCLLPSSRTSATEPRHIGLPDTSFTAVSIFSCYFTATCND